MNFGFIVWFFQFCCSLSIFSPFSIYNRFQTDFDAFHIVRSHLRMGFFLIFLIVWTCFVNLFFLHCSTYQKYYQDCYICIFRELFHFDDNLFLVLSSFCVIQKKTMKLHFSKWHFLYRLSLILLHSLSNSIFDYFNVFLRMDLEYDAFSYSYLLNYLFFLEIILHKNFMNFLFSLIVLKVCNCIDI